MKQLFGAPLANWFRNIIRNSKYRWLVILGSLFYLVSPLDISPDVFPIVGWIDDGLLATIVMAELTQMVIERRKKGDKITGESFNATEIDDAIDVDSVTVS